MFYEEVLAQLQAADLRFLVAGAVAMNLHGVPEADQAKNALGARHLLRKYLQVPVEERLDLAQA